MNKIKELLSKIKMPTTDQLLNIVKIFMFLFIAIILFVPIFLGIKYLKSKNKRIQLHPEFKILDIENNSGVDDDVLAEAVKIGKEMLDRIKKEKEKKE
jgi:hypothetical protein